MRNGKIGLDGEQARNECVCTIAILRNRMGAGERNIASKLPPRDPAFAQPRLQRGLKNKSTSADERTAVKAASSFFLRLRLGVETSVEAASVRRVTF